MYMIVGFLLFLSFGGWGRPGNLSFYEPSYPFGRVCGIIWLYLWPLTILLFLINFHGDFNIWNMTYIAVTAGAILLLGKELLVKKNHDLIKIIQSYLGFVVLCSTMISFVNLLSLN